MTWSFCSRNCWVRPMRTARSSPIPSPVLALTGTMATFLVKSLTLSKRSLLKPSRLRVPIMR